MKTIAFSRLIFLSVLLSLVSGRLIASSRRRRSLQKEYKLCVPEELMELCSQMASQETKSTARITCVAARDRLSCMDKIKHREADFIPVDPEDMYAASQLDNQDFTVFEEIRTLEEPEAEFRYEGVAVVHKDLNVSEIKQIKGLNSCHTGIGRNVGYKIPLTKLKNMGIIGNLNIPELSARENELKALSELFSKACIVGQWSPEPTINSKLKNKYANLCELCEDPAKCDYPDIYSGYDGALRCLAHNGGNIAWTKVIYVRKFFGLPVGITPAKPTTENPDNFAYLCPDGTKVPVSGKPCRWAARPWQGYLTNAVVVKTVDELRTKIANLYAVGSRLHAPWLDRVLELNNKTLPRERKIIDPKDFLDNANYTDVIERDYGPPYKTVRFCALSDTELEKCRYLSRAAFSRDIRPRFDCVQEKVTEDCLKTIRDNGADIITLSASQVDEAHRKYNLKPIIAEVYGKAESSNYAVAVVRKNSLYKSFVDLRKSRSCHSGFGEPAGYNVPLYTLLNLGLIKSSACPYWKGLAEFFAGGSCVPGAKDAENEVPEKIAEQLCLSCGGNVDSNDGTSLDSKCNSDITESYFGDKGAFRCLVQGQGDVAFLDHSAILDNTDGNNPESWASALKSKDYELLCPNGGRAPVSDYKKCNLAVIPPRMVVTSNSKTDAEIDEISNALISTSKFYTKRPDLFKLFGPYNNTKNLLFKDTTTGLAVLEDNTSILSKYSQILETVGACQQQV